MKYYRTWKVKQDGGGQATHLEGIGDAYALCGMDIAGDDLIHENPPVELVGRHRVTCKQCLQVIELVKGYLAEGKAVKP